MTNKIADHDGPREKFRQFALSTGTSLHPERLRFVYLYEEVQKKVMEVLTKGNATRTTKVLEVRGCNRCLCHVDQLLRQVDVAWHQDNRLMRPFFVSCCFVVASACHHMATAQQAVKTIVCSCCFAVAPDGHHNYGTRTTCCRDCFLCHVILLWRQMAIIIMAPGQHAAKTVICVMLFCCGTRQPSYGTRTSC